MLLHGRPNGSSLMLPEDKTTNKGKILLFQSAFLCSADPLITEKCSLVLTFVNLIL